ncbi:hypothetical protein K461DRAFT_15201 [Myriangium duriaei CBS 260.36]|uniref:Uncharacterized protein n=1 Tax=Myriangium duriaei CBS 260.36 TaxID=1168546 RepID=A0A9P4MLG1_9PEZI|nr:hypothetical protein K461DRAFT_15201 [Myriangium duriaei CBS 260.36]
MVSSKIHSRHPTWPPTVQLLPNIITEKEKTPRSLLKPETRYTATLPEITEDEDPFSHFLSPVLDEESSFEETNYTAGIVPYDSSSSSTSRRDALFRARLEEKWETFVARRLLQHSRSGSAAIPAPLPPPFPQEPTTPPNEDALPDLFDDSMDLEVPGTPEDGPSSPDQHGWYFPSTIDGSGSDYNDMSDDDMSDPESLDGWESDRRETALRERQMQQLSPRRKFRSARSTLSSGKKHAWREPSPGLWTVEEEDEVPAEVEDDLRSRRRSRKRAKTVHWNEQVQVLEYER